MPRFCTKCGTPMQQDALFCTSCGTKAKINGNKNISNQSTKNCTGFSHRNSLHDLLDVHANVAKHMIRERVVSLQTSKTQIEQNKPVYKPFYARRFFAKLGLVLSIGLLILWPRKNISENLIQLFMKTEVDFTETTIFAALDNMRLLPSVTILLSLIAFIVYFSFYLILKYNQYNRSKSFLRRIKSIEYMCDSLQKTELFVHCLKQRIAETVSLGKELTWKKSNQSLCIEDIRQTDVISSPQKNRPIDHLIRRTYRVFGFLSIIAILYISLFTMINLSISYRNVYIENYYQRGYNSAKNLLNNGQYLEARNLFFQIIDYEDAAMQYYKLLNLNPIDGGVKHNIALSTEGTVLHNISDGPSAESIANWKDIVSVFSGYAHVLGLKRDGTVVAAGSNVYGQIDISEWQNIVGLSAGESHTVGLKKDGTVLAVGANGSGQTNVSGWRNIVSIAAGRSHTVGLRKDGTVVAVGSNSGADFFGSGGQIDVSDWKEIVAIASGHAHTVGLRRDGTVVAVGWNSSLQTNVTRWNNIVAISAGSAHTVGLKKDGTVVAVGANGTGQTNVHHWRDIIAIYAGNYSTLGIKKDGTVVVAGKHRVRNTFINDYEIDVHNFISIGIPAGSIK